MRTIFYLLLCSLASCQMNSKGKDASSKETYKLTINPPPSAQYFYDIENETSLETEVDGKEVNKKSTSVIGLMYAMRSDTLGNRIVDMTFDKILIRTKSDDGESELNADNASMSFNPVEKMLGLLKGAKLTAVLNAKGETKEVRGYKELGDKLIATFAEEDNSGKEVAKKQWENLVRQQLVDNNLQQLFKVFPDSLVHIGAKWSITTKYDEQFKLRVDNTFTLEDINDKVATLNVTGVIKPDQNGTNPSNPEMEGSLSGKQEGVYKIDITTGMPVSSIMESKTKGKLQAMGTEMPIDIENKITIKRRK